MKRHSTTIFASFIALFVFFLIPKFTLAASCISQGGHCTATKNCLGGPAITSDFCGIGKQCCPDEGGSCTVLGGQCYLSFFNCSKGAAIENDSCPSGNKCCPKQPGNSNQGPEGIKCTLDSSGKTGVNTAIGCVAVESGNDLVTTILRLATGVGGGLALALILYGVFIVTTSAGMPDKLKAGSEIITSAVIGLVFILLSVFLVNLIGINILGIPGLS